MKKLPHLALFLSILLFVNNALAVPACPEPIVVTEPSTGNAIAIQNYGDEFFNFSTTADGYIVVADGEGRLRYIVSQNGAYELGPYVLSGKERSSSKHNDRSYVSIDAKDLKENLSRLQQSLAPEAKPFAANSTRLIPMGYDFVGDALEGHVKLYTNEEFAHVSAPPMASTCGLLVLKIEFNNVSCAFDDAAWHKRIFSDGVAQYYKTVSGGKFSYVPALETSGQANDGVITVKLPIEAPVYTSKNPANQNMSNGITAGLYHGSDQKNYAIYNEGSLFAYAVQEASKVMDLKAYDRNMDGYVSPTELAFILVFAGYEAAVTGTFFATGKPAVWAHSWVYNNYLSTTPSSEWFLATCVADQVEMYKYTIMGENCSASYDYENPNPLKPAQQAQFGTACHELGHDQGLYDLYDTWYQGLSENVGQLSLMSGGNWCYHPGEEPGSSPSHLDPFSKVFLNFYTAQVVNQNCAYRLFATEPSDKYNILRINTQNPDIYYLVENRRFVGYDSGLMDDFGTLAPGGIVIWRIDDEMVRDYYSSNWVNNYEGRFGVMPVFLDKTRTNPYFMPLPFWGGVFRTLGQVATLQVAPKIELICREEAGDSTVVRLHYNDSPMPPDTGDNAQPILWLVLGVSAIAAIIIVSFWRKKKKS